MNADGDLADIMRRRLSSVLLVVSPSVRAVSSMSLQRLTPDVDPKTYLAANGFVRIGPAAGKGLGAFANYALFPYYEIGRYEGIVLRGEDELHARYGKNRGEVPDEHLEWHREWKVECERRGVGTSGAYVVAAGTCPMTGKKVFVDAEDEETASWCRYLNHSQKRPNLSMGTMVRPDGKPVVRFVVEREIKPGDELLFNYGENYWSFDDPIDEDSWDDPRLFAQ